MRGSSRNGAEDVVRLQSIRTLTQEVYERDQANWVCRPRPNGVADGPHLVRGGFYLVVQVGSRAIPRRSAVSKRGVHVVDAPVAGGVVFARDDTLDAMVGGRARTKVARLWEKRTNASLVSK